ncbi:MAG: ComF family protein [Gemmatimonadaceae bacterium]|nr:ComF family protein [Gemmatimonadaceae bacterium]
MRGPLKDVMRAAADLLFPVTCAACERLLDAGESGVICGRCLLGVRELPHPRCDRCGHPIGSYTCRWCPLLPAFVRAARSFCWIGAGTGGDIVHALKYGGWVRAAPAIAQRMQRVPWPRDVIEERTATVAVPLALSRLRERGFNQSVLLAGHLASAWGIPSWPDAIERTRATRSQTELTPAERLGNVAGAFRVSRPALSSIHGAHLILVDDVVTTGATLKACASALFASGARTISYMTFGRAPASGDRVIP